MRGWFLGVLLACAVVATLASACSKDAAAPTIGGPTGAQGSETINDSCSTPSLGCSCDTVGQTVACGRVDDVNSDGFTLCSYGTRSCGSNNQWGACIGTTTTQRLPLETTGAKKPAVTIGSTHTLDLGVSTECSSTDVCDPYCNTFIDTPVGILFPGFGNGDGGFVVLPPDAGDAGAAAAGTLQTTSNGKDSCSGATDLISTTTCGTAPFTSCQQDSRCDGASNMCKWNGGQGYYDNAATGPDLEIGASCGGGTGAVYIPLCNRGTTTIAAGTSLGVNFTAGVPDGCTAIGAADCTTVAPAAGLAPGSCVNLACNVPSGDLYAVVNAGGTRDVTEPTGRCGNNGAYVQPIGAPGCNACAVCNTTVTGQVWDPGGNVPLSNVTVYELAGTTGAVPPLTDNAGAPQCDTCASLLPPSTYSVAANTDANGNFTLNDATPGTNQTIVAQSGRWRRKLYNVTVNACVPNPVATDGTELRLPSDHSTGDDIPKIALVMGNRESTECWLKKVGIATDEISAYTGSGTNRIQLFRTDGQTEGPHDGYSANTPPDPDTALWGSSGAINDYSAILIPCASISSGESGTAQTNMTNYVNGGGRIFVDHLSGNRWLTNGPWPTVATWNSNTIDGQGTVTGTISNATPVQTDFYNWMAANSGDAPGTVSIGNAYKEAYSPSTGTVDWVDGPSYSLSFSFETPLGNAPGTTCGRAIYNAMHVSQTRANGSYPTGSSQQFPGNCNTGPGMTPEERALEYQFFQLTACALGGAPPSVPPPPPTLTAETYYIDYQATCEAGTAPVWQVFDWHAIVLPGTNIAFRAATAATEGDLPASPPASDPTTVSIGNATFLQPNYANYLPVPPAVLPLPPPTVDYDLRNPASGMGNPSLAWLRVYMTFNPLGIISPILVDWQQFYDCVPAQ